MIDTSRLALSNLKRENDALKKALAGLKAIDDNEIARWVPIANMHTS